MSVAQITMMYELSKPVYNNILRPLVVEAVKDSESFVDDVLLKVCDLAFEHGTTEEQIKTAYELVKLLYVKCFRKLAIRAIAKTETDVDDHLLELCDTVFEYKEAT